MKERKINLLLTALPFFLERHYSDSQPKIFTTSFCRGNNLQQHIQMERGFQSSWSSASRVFDKESPGTSKRGRTSAGLPASPCAALVAAELLKPASHTGLPKGPGSMEEGLKDGA